MLENCVDLKSCEAELVNALKCVKLLGEIPLSDEDIGMLGEMVKKSISPDISIGTRYLRTQAPVTMACFLVGMGRFYDKDGGFWPIVEQKVGLIDVNRRVEWGRFFLQFLKDNNLPKFDEEDGLAYVTPILAHTCIPDSCLAEYFYRVLLPLVDRDLLDPWDEQEIIHDLKLKRKINSSRLILEQNREEHVARIGDLQKEIRFYRRRLEEYKEIASLLAEEEESKNRRTALHGLEEAEVTRANLVNRMQETNEKIHKLETEGLRLWEEMVGLKKRYQPIIEQEVQINGALRTYQQLQKEVKEARSEEQTAWAVVLSKWECLSTKPWTEEIKSKILQFPVEQLDNQIREFHNLQASYNATQKNLENLRASQKKSGTQTNIFRPLLIFIKKVLVQIGVKGTTHQPDELQQLQTKLAELSTAMQQEHDRIEDLSSRLPLADNFLINPDTTLCEEINTLQQNCAHFTEDRTRRIELENKEKEHTRYLQELATFSGIVVDKHFLDWDKKLMAILQEAQQGQIAIQKTSDILEREIRPALDAARGHNQKLQADLSMLDFQLEELGGGSLLQGINLIKEYRQSQEAVATKRINLVFQSSDFRLFEGDLKSMGYDAIRLNSEKDIAEVEKHIQEIRSEVRRLDKGYDHYPAQYAGIDEPIRRFLLYGGTTAEKILSASVSLLARAKSGERIEEISEPDLHPRFIQQFQQWWESYKTKLELKSSLEEVTNPATGERFHSPQVLLDTMTAEVIARLPSQRILRPERSTTVRLDAVGADGTEPIFSTQLRLYNRTKGLAETLPQETILLTEPSPNYIFRLMDRDHLIYEWEIQVLSANALLMAFSRKTYRSIKGVTLPRSPLIIAIKDNYNLHPEKCILTDRCSLFGGWKEYSWYEVDLTDIEELILSSDDGQNITIPLISDSGTGITLIGGHQQAAVVSDDRPIFDIAPEYIRIPAVDQNGLHLSRLSLLFEDESGILKSKHYQLDELVNSIDILGQNWLDIPLNVDQLLGTNPTGSYTLRVYKPPYLDWQSSFCVVPQFNISFDRIAYSPHLEGARAIQATLSLPETSIFKPDSPAELGFNEGSSWPLKTPASEDRISGVLSYPITRESKIAMPLTIMIPKVRWRLQGSDETAYDTWLDVGKDELWLGDWIQLQELFLLVEVPLSYKGEIALVLQANSVIVEQGRMQDHKIRFDLKALEDTLRAGPPVETFTILLKEAQTGVTRIPLFSIRTRWQAEKIKCFHYPEGDTIKVEAYWDEKGEVTQKVARLWYLSDTQPRLIQDRIIEPALHKVTFSSTAAVVKPGKYLIHIEPYELWSSRAICPKLNDANTAIIEIVTGAHEKAVTIRSIALDPKHRYPFSPGSYRIHIIGRVVNQKLPEDVDVKDIDHVLVTPTNENWYVGNLEVNGIPEVIAHLSDTNPVKFEYDAEKKIVTSIEDRHGDGAVYCYDCKMLFWYQETVLKEKNKKHHNYGPIEEFWVDWEA